MIKKYRKPHQFKKKKSIIRNKFFWLVILIAGLIGFSLYFFLFFGTFQVKKIIIQGENKVAKEDILFLIEENLENKILFFQTKTILLVNLNDITKKILNDFPEIAEIEIKRIWPDGINLLVKERKGMANWCKNENCFLLDEEGIIFEEIAEINPDLTIIIEPEPVGHEDETGEDVLPSHIFAGARVVEKDDFKKILNIESQIKTDFNIPIKNFVIDSKDKLIVNTREGWQIYFNLQGDIGWQITKLMALIKEKLPPENRGGLEYIELRFGNFANPKYRD